MPYPILGRLAQSHVPKLCHNLKLPRGSFSVAPALQDRDGKLCHGAKAGAVAALVFSRACDQPVPVA